MSTQQDIIVKVERLIDLRIQYAAQVTKELRDAIPALKQEIKSLVDNI